ncbi:MAG: Xaa-Pro peptidase family protein [Deltaproteobacteria bacterium]|nr:Xaa-Pro peptidase family protein [Deltaproteobacteria bacterium]
MWINEPRAKRLLAAHDLDGLLAATNIPNVFYLSGVWRRQDIAAVVTRDAVTAPWLVIPRSEVDYMVDTVPPAGGVTYGTFHRVMEDNGPLTPREQRIRELGIDPEPVTNFFEGLVRTLENAALDRSRLGYDERGLDPALAERLRERFPHLELVPAMAVFREIRMVKSPAEIERMTEAVRVTEQSIYEAAHEAREGMTEAEMCLAFDLGQVRRGAEPNMNHVGFGRSAALGMTNMPDDTLKVGDMIRFDVGCLYKGYLTDMSRTFSFGPPDDKFSRYYNAVLKGQDLALSLVKPGKVASEIFHDTVAEVRETGIPHYARQHVGHGIGLGLGGYDRPTIAPSDDTPLEADMVLCIETPYYEMGWGSVQVEDMIVVTEDGYRRLTSVPRHLQVLEPRS